jgi:alkyl sulfatase BDS1-like metallo-beta-lactamase superfamily hydrolase
MTTESTYRKENIMKFQWTRFLVLIALGSYSAQDVVHAQSPQERLSAQAAQFPEKVIKVADGVYTAVGYSVSNSSMIVGDDGVIIIDTGLDIAGGDVIAKKFREITNKPVKAIIFTHSHGDHTGGATAFFGKERPQIWAHADFGSEADPLTKAGLTFQRVRGARQAGFRLPPEQRINNGIAPAQYPKRGGAAFASAKDTTPTHTFDTERKQIEISGVTLELVASPGETNDQIYVWLPKQEVLFSGDNFYRSFPNLYAIRGTPNRSVRLWVESLSKLLDHKAVGLVGGHTLPVIGEKAVREVVTDYRDAVKFVHDKTVEGMNKGLTPDQLVEYVQLPKHLADKDYLQPFYGHVEWGVRSIFNGYLGWFDGNPTNLFRLAPKAEAERIARLAGGGDKLITAAKAALESDDPQWAAQLADYLITLEPEAERPKQIKAEALTMLASKQVNALARNYYLTVARELLTTEE